RLRMTVTSSGGRACFIGRMARMSARVSSRTSPSALVSGFFLLISANLLLMCLAKADDTNATWNSCEYDCVQPVRDEFERKKSRFGAVESFVCAEHGAFPLKLRHEIKWQPTVAGVGYTLGRIEFDLHI